MFRPIPQDFIEESWAAWRASRKQHAADDTKEKQTAQPRDSGQEHAPERVFLFTEEELRPAPRKRHAPPEGVSFF